MRLIPLIALSATLAACDRAATPAPPPGAETSDSDMSAEVAAVGDEAEMVMASAAAASLPDYIPVPADATTSTIQTANGVTTATLMAPGDPAAVLDQMEAGLKAGGMNPARQDMAPGSGTLFAREKGRDVKITVTKAPAGGALIGVFDQPGAD